MKKVVYLIIAVVLFILGKLLLQGDFSSFLQWWLTLVIISISFMPLTNLIFARFHDRGYLFSKPIGLAVTGYLMWLFSSLHLLKFTPQSCILCAILGLALNGLILVLNKKKSVRGFDQPVNKEQRWFGKQTDTILAQELFFLAVFLLFTYIRGFKPEAYGTEKFMDYGFMTTMMRSEFMPPQDLWFSGTSINYYYVGQYLATFLTKLSSVQVSLAYNLMLTTVGALAVVLPYSLVYNIAAEFLKEKEKKGRFFPVGCGLLAGIAVCLAGNMHYPVFRWLEPLVRKFFGMEASTSKYWFPDATRYIGYHPETTDKTIHEFPAYSFVLGDLHAHVINIMFVLTVIAILFAWMCGRRERKSEKPPLWKEVMNPAILMLAFFIGLFHTTNFWDYPIYYVVAGAVILFTNLIVYNFNRINVFLVTALQGAFIFGAAEIVCLPFTLKFNPISSAICLADAHTPLNQLIILWGLPVFIVIAFLCFMVDDFFKDRKTELSTDENRSRPMLPRFMEALTGPDLFIITLGLCAIGLVLLPELIYVKDIYSGDYKRANTMFKLTYQAFLIFGLCFGYIYLRLLCFARSKRQLRVAATGLILFGLSVCYIQNAVNAWYGNVFAVSGYQGQNATAFMITTMPDDSLAINWLNDNVTGTPVVLEAPGDSYTDYERVSVMTGLPTVLGWHTHEWLWKSDTTVLDERAADIERIYTSTDKTKVRNLLEKYKVSYIYVGKLEEEKYPELNSTLLKSLGKTVFLSPANQTKDYETYIIQVVYDDGQ